MTNKNPLLKFSNICYKYSNQSEYILKNFSLEVFESDFIFLIGPNGAGKSTFFNLVMSSIHESPNKFSFKKNIKIEYLSQDIANSLFMDLTVKENTFLFRLNKLTTPELKFYLDGFNSNLSKYFEVPVKYLSGGEKQAFVLAMKLFKKPDLLLLDEFTSALDPAAEKKLMNLTNQKILENKITTIISTHNLNLLKNYGQKVIGIKNGSIAFNEKKLNDTIDKYFKFIFS